MTITAFSPVNDNSSLPLEQEIDQLKGRIVLQKKTINKLSANGHEFLDAGRQLSFMYEKLAALLKARRNGD